MARSFLGCCGADISPQLAHRGVVPCFGVSTITLLSPDPRPPLSWKILRNSLKSPGSCFELSCKLPRWGCALRRRINDNSTSGPRRPFFLEIFWKFHRESKHFQVKGFIKTATERCGYDSSTRVTPPLLSGASLSSGWYGSIVSELLLR